jgi:2,3-bisphosphoglycerate-independent phosphoglycerate mutase
LIVQLEENMPGLIVANFANCDMVGHTGIFDAAKKAARVVDEAASRVISKAASLGYVVLVTADHGNAEKMTENGAPFTAHTTFPVWLTLCGLEGARLSDGALADIAPTLLDAMGLGAPPEMEGNSLLTRSILS